MDIQDFLGLLDNVKSSRSGHTARCPSHDDKNNSLSVSEGDDGRILVKCFAGCDVEQICGALNIEKKDLFCSHFIPPAHTAHMHTCSKHTKNIAKKPVQLKKPVLHTCTLAEYSRAKKIPEDFLLSLGLKDCKYLKRDAIRISYLDKNGHERSVRYRVASKGECFRWRSGCKAMLYGLWRKITTDWIFLVEGESDCHTLWYHDIPAYGVPGAATWNENRDGSAFNDFNRICIVIEPDTGGESVKKWLSRSSIQDRAFVVDLGEYKDPSGLYLSDPSNFKDNINRYMDKAVPWSEVEKQIREDTLENSWAECSELAQKPSILCEFANLIASCGLAGEVKAAKLVFLSLITRILDRPVNNIIEGPSAGGKSFLVGRVVEFFPEDTYLDMTAMSDRSLVYTDRDLRHIFIVLYEASALSSETGAYIIRSLLSENRIKYLVTEKTPEGTHVSRYITKEGPTGLIMTTTAVFRHPENETRTLAISINDTQQQTQDVFRAIANTNNPPIDFTPWHALQNYLQANDNKVVIPYSQQLAELTKPVAVRLRRDFGALLSLISAHALLHRASRGVGCDGNVIATIEDYATVLDLIGDIVSQNVDASVRNTIKETVRAAEYLLDTSDHDYTTILAVARQLNLDRASANRRINTAIRHNYLKTVDQKTKEKRIVLGDPLPGDVSIFPDPDELSVHVCKPVHLGVAHQNDNNSDSYGDVCMCATESGEKKE
jgi:hypothetical protein